MTDRYLNPVVPENYTNRGTTGDFSLSYDRDFTPKDRLTLSVRHELSRYEIPNELAPADSPANMRTPPPATPQLQTADNFETMGIASYQHIFSSDVLANFRGMVRDNSADLNSNTDSWPIAAFQHNDFKEGYFNAAVSIHHGHHEWKAGLESDNLFLHENFSDIITANPNLPLIPTIPSIPPPPPRSPLPAAVLISNSPPSFRISSTSATGPSTLASAGTTINSAQSKRRQPAFFRRALFPRRESDRPRLLRPHLSNAIVRKHPAVQFHPGVTSLEPHVLRLPVNLPTATTSKSAPPRAFSTSSASTPIISAATSTTTPTTTRSSTLPSASPSPSAKPSSTAPKPSSNSRTGTASPAFSAIPTSWATPGSR